MKTLKQVISMSGRSEAKVYKDARNGRLKVVERSPVIRVSNRSADRYIASFRNA